MNDNNETLKNKVDAESVESKVLEPKVESEVNEKLPPSRCQRNVKRGAVAVLACAALMGAFCLGYAVNEVDGVPQKAVVAQNDNALCPFVRDVALRPVVVPYFQPDALNAILPDLPRITTRDSAKAVVVTANLPALKPENVKVKIQGHNLFINADQEKDKIARAGSDTQEQCNMSTFQATLPLPRNIQSDKMHTSFNNGVLTVSIPKT